jgi:signal transduction histidine kinase
MTTSPKLTTRRNGFAETVIWLGGASAVVGLVWLVMWLRGYSSAGELQSFRNALHPEWFGMWYSAFASGLSIAVLGRLHRIGGTRSALGRGMLLLVLAQLSWACGELLWFTYTTCDVWGPFACAMATETPYPSLADLFYLSFYPLAVAGLLRLAQAIGLSRRRLLRYWWILVPVALVCGSAFMPSLEIGGVVFGGGARDPDATALAFVATMGYVLFDIGLLTLAVIVALRARQAPGALLFIPVTTVAVAAAGMAIGDFLFFTSLAPGQEQLFAFSDLAYGVSAPIFPMVALWLLRQPARTSAGSRAVEGSWYERAIGSVIDGNEDLLGPTAVSAAETVPGLRVSSDRVRITSRSAHDVMDDLLEVYERLAGGLSQEIAEQRLRALDQEPPAGEPDQLLSVARKRGALDASAELPGEAPRVFDVVALLLLALGLILLVIAERYMSGSTNMPPVAYVGPALALAAVVVALGSARLRPPWVRFVLVPTVVAVASVMTAATGAGGNPMQYLSILALVLMWSAVFAPRPAFNYQLAVTVIALSVIGVLRSDVPADRGTLVLILVASVVPSLMVRRTVRLARRSTAALEQANDSLTDLLTQVDQNRSAERHRIAGEIHDFALQGLLAAQMHLRRAASTKSDPREALTAAESLLSDSIRSLRAVLRGIEPFPLYNADLAAALRSLATSIEGAYQTKVVLDIETEFDLAAHYQLAVYRITAEAITNAARHAQASTIRLHAHSRGGEIHITVTDDGIGFVSGPPNLEITNPRGSAGIGLRLMAEQVRQLGGTIKVRTERDAGSTIEVCIPHPAEGKSPQVPVAPGAERKV